MKRLPLTNSPKFALVDNVDYARARRHRWHLSDNGGVKSNDNPQMWLHQFVFGKVPRGKEIDHHNRNRLDNQRRNLRVGTHQQNQCNRGKQKNNTTGFKGVYFNRDHGRWGVSIGVKGKYIFIGRFDDPVKAARAYDAAARRYHGRFARTNFPMRFPRLAVQNAK